MPEKNESTVNRMLTEQRRRKIIEMVQNAGLLTINELVDELGVSQITVWRDLSALDQEGKVQRVRGGVTRVESGAAEEPLYRSKQILHKEKKKQIGQYAAGAFVQENDIIILEAGTTVGAMIEFLTQRNLTVMTNGLGNLNKLSLCVPDVNVMACGGILRSVAFTLVGPQAIEFFQKVRAKTLFLSCTGLAFPEGITDPNPLEIEVKRAMAESASQIVLMVDSTKFGVRSLTPIIPLEKIKALVTDPEAPVEDLEQLRRLGINVHIATG